MTRFPYMLINTLQLGVRSSLLNLCGFQESLKTFRMFEIQIRDTSSYIWLLFSH